MPEQCQHEDDCRTPMWCRGKDQCANATEPHESGSDQRRVRPIWRLLNRFDMVQASDEFLTDDCETWDSCANAARFIVGQKYDSTFFQPMRRRIDGTNDKDQAQPTDQNQPSKT